MTAERLEPSLFAALGALFRSLPASRRRALLPLVGLILLGAFAELATLGALVPFLGMIADPGGAHSAWLAPLLAEFGANQSNAAITVLVALFAGAALASAGLRLLMLWSTNAFIGGVAVELSTRLYADTLHEPYQFHTSRNSSEIIAIVNKTQLLTFSVLGPIMNGTAAVVVACFIVGGLLFVDSVVAVLAGVGFVVIYVLVSRVARKRLKANSVIISRMQSERVKTMQDGLGGIRDVLLDQSQSLFVGEFHRAEQRYWMASIRNAFYSGAPRFVVEAAGMVLIAAIAVVMAARPGGLPNAFPVLGALALGAQRLLPLIQQIYGAWAAAMGNKQVVLDVYDLLRRSPPDTTPSDVALPFERAIELRDVSFDYRPDGTPTIRNIDLVIEKGARIGLAGRTGSGKSTLVDIVLGLLQPASGSILVDGVPLSSANRLAWQRNMAHVPQTIYLADSSIAENIAFGVPPDRIDPDRVRRAAEQAELDGVIAALPDGYSTRVGERGVQLSGGQRQRIGIARALYKQASVLVLDEATSALDTETEAAVMASIDRLDRNLTIIIIAHRLSTLDACDMVVWLEAGKVRALEPRPSGTMRRALQ